MFCILCSEDPQLGGLDPRLHRCTGKGSSENPHREPQTHRGPRDSFVDMGVSVEVETGISLPSWTSVLPAKQSEYRTGKWREKVEWETRALRGSFPRPQTKRAAELRYEHKPLMLILQHASEPWCVCVWRGRDVVKHRLLDPTPITSDSVCLVKGPKLHF